MKIFGQGITNCVCEIYSISPFPSGGGGDYDRKILENHIKKKHAIPSDPDKPLLNRKNYFCVLCETKVPFGKSFHIKKYHCDENGKAKCPICGFTLSNHLNINQHYLQHKKIPCSKCGEMFGTSRMARHSAFSQI